MCTWLQVLNIIWVQKKWTTARNEREKERKNAVAYRWNWIFESNMNNAIWIISISLYVDIDTKQLQHAKRCSMSIKVHVPFPLNTFDWWKFNQTQSSTLNFIRIFIFDILHFCRWCFCVLRVTCESMFKIVQCVRTFSGCSFIFHSVCLMMQKTSWKKRLNGTLLHALRLREYSINVFLILCKGHFHNVSESAPINQTESAEIYSNWIK